jgi:hypothetical protein
MRSGARPESDGANPSGETPDVPTTGEPAAPLNPPAATDQEA